MTMYQLPLYQLPLAVLREGIQFMEWYGGPQCVAVPFSSELKYDWVEELAKTIAEILKDNTGIPQITVEESGNRWEKFYGFQVRPNGITNAFMHTPRYRVNATRIHPDFISGAESLVVVVPEDKGCQHCVKSLERLTEILSNL